MPIRSVLPLLLATLLIAGCAASMEPPAPVEVVLPVEVSGRATAATDPGSDVTFVAYPVQRGGQTDIYLARLDGQDATSLAPVRVNQTPGDAAAHQQAPAQVAVGTDGSLYVVWITQRRVEGRRFPASDLRFARSDDGGQTFSPTVTVNPDAGIPTTHHFHNIAVAPDGTIYVGWLDSTTRDKKGGASASHHHHGAGSHHGSGDDGAPGTELHVARSTDGGRTFQTPVVVTRNTCQCCRVSMAVGADGTLYVGWRHLFGGTERDIAVSASRDGGQTFSAPARVHADRWRIEGCPHAGPALSIDRNGDLHVAWYTGASERVGVYYAASRDGGRTFTEPTTLAREVPVAQVAVASNASGTSVAWELPLEHQVRVWRPGTALDAATTRQVDGLLPSFAAGRSGLALIRTDENRALLTTGL